MQNYLREKPLLLIFSFLEYFQGHGFVARQWVMSLQNSMQTRSTGIFPIDPLDHMQYYEILVDPAEAFDPCGLSRDQN